MNTIPVSLPVYQGNKSLRFGTSARLTAEQYDNIDRLKEAIGAPSKAIAIALCIMEELNAIHAQKRTKGDFIYSDDAKRCTFPFKLTIEEREAVAEIQSFYDAPTLSAVIAHVIDWNIRILDAQKDGE